MAKLECNVSEWAALNSLISACEVYAIYHLKGEQKEELEAKISIGKKMLIDATIKGIDAEDAALRNAEDRGAADSYYRRKRKPNYRKEVDGVSVLVWAEDMTEEQIKAYNRGFDRNEEEQVFKDYRD